MPNVQPKLRKRAVPTRRTKAAGNKVRAPQRRFPQNRGVFTCYHVVHKRKPVLFVSHAGGDWQMYCSNKAHDFDDQDTMNRELTVVHVEHLLEWDPSLWDVADLPVDMGAERTRRGGPWKRFVDRDDD